MIVPMLRVGMPQGTLRVPAFEWDAERPGLHSHAERGNDQQNPVGASLLAIGRAAASGILDQVLKRRTNPSSSFDNPARLCESSRAELASSATNCASP